MTRRSFQALLSEFFQAPGTSDVRSAPGEGLCRCDGVDVAVYHDARTDPGYVHAYIDVGAVPAERERDIFRTLLQRQMLLAPPHRTVVGLDAASGNIVVVARIPFDAMLDGARLLGVVRQLIGQVVVWRSPATPHDARPAGRRTRRRPS